MKALATWSNEELAAVLLSDLYRIYDAGGISDGRSHESILLDEVRDLLNLELPAGADPGNRPPYHVLLEEARRRRHLRPLANMAGE